jgi:hypothetical protein
MTRTSRSFRKAYRSSILYLNQLKALEGFRDEIEEAGFKPRPRDKNLSSSLVTPWDDIPVSSFRESRYDKDIL